MYVNITANILLYTVRHVRMILHMFLSFQRAKIALLARIICSRGFTAAALFTLTLSTEKELSRQRGAKN